jgi:hypothetical protein
MIFADRSQLASDPEKNLRIPWQQLWRSRSER